MLSRRCVIGSDPQWILMADYGKDGPHGVFDFFLCGESNITPSEESTRSLSHVPLSNKLNHEPIMSCHRSTWVIDPSHILSLASLRLRNDVRCLPDTILLPTEIAST